MKRWIIFLISLISLLLLPGKNSPAPAISKSETTFGRGEVVEQTNPGKCLNPDRLHICWGRSAIVWVDTNDPRFSGEVNLFFDSISTRVPYSERLKGDFLLNRIDGSWKGAWKGITNTQSETLFIGVGRGQGDYEGQVLRWQMKRSGSNWNNRMQVTWAISNPELPGQKR